ncbi:MAG: hypothetical protein J6U40_05320, partial [Kiritimatiellae bacterium]|nr:hypothetical protein [Kiritimatiellia bacterium]
GEDKLAAAYCAVIEAAIADADADWTTGAAELNVPTGTGAENNVPAAFLSGLTRARTLDLAAYSGQVLTTLGVVPYVKNDAAPTENLSRVGYYIELKRKNDAQSDFHGLVRWLWVSMDAFGGKTIEDVGVPLTIYNQALVRRLRVASNMPGIASTAADATSETGWVEFWPSSYTNGDCGNSDAPANTYGYDWDDTRSDNMSGYGAMQVHRFTPGARNPAQTLFAFNRWSSSGSWEIGLGNFSHVRLGSIDWTFSGDPGKNMTETMSADAYEIAKLEIWTASMENDPDAPTAALVYIDSVIGEGATSATVTGSLVEFGIGAENATVTLEWSTDPAFATIAGSQSLGTISETGPLTATATGLTAGSTWYFRFTSVNSTGKTAASETSDPLTLTAGYWRPQPTADIWTSIAWLKDNTGSPVAFNPLWTAVFDGLEPTKTTTVQIPEAVEAKMVRVEGGADYTFDGDGTIASERLVKAGSGTLTLESRVLANTTDIEIRGGVVRLGDNAIVGAAGTSGGSIIVKDGGQFDFNHIDNESGNNRPRALITSGKTFVIEGEGPDGSGALTSTADNTYWGSPINEVVLTGDATIGGKSRIDIRGGSRNSITGPDDATLTIKNSAINRTRGLNVHGPISVGKMVITEEGCYTPEGGAFTLTIPNGIELRGALSMWAATGAWNVGGLVAVGDKAYIGNDSGTSYVRTDVTVQEGATLSLGGGGTTRYANAVTNRGTIVTTSNGHYIDAELVNEGNPLMQLNGDIHNYATTVTGDSRAEIKSGYYWTSGITDWGESALDVALSGGGTFVFGQNNDGYAYPKFGKNKLSVTVADGHTGTFFLHSHHSGTSDGVTITGPLNNFLAHGPNNGSAVIDSYN